MLRWQWSADRDLEVWEDDSVLRAIITRDHIYDCATDSIVDQSGSLVSQLAYWGLHYGNTKYIERCDTCIARDERRSNNSANQTRSS